MIDNGLFLEKQKAKLKSIKRIKNSFEEIVTTLGSI